MDGERTSPLHLQLQVGALSRDGGRIDFSASPAECGRVAAALEIESVASIRTELIARPFRKDGARVSGRLHAVVVQKSIVTLEPVKQTIDEPFDMAFVREARRPVDPLAADVGEIFVDPEADDPPETFSGDSIDLGERLFEALSLALDPYPRRAGESLASRPDAPPEPEQDDDEVVSPFAVLSNFSRSKDGGKD